MLAACTAALPSGAVAQVRDSGTTVVAVPAQLTVSIPSLAELRLDVADVRFDLGEGLQSSTMACVYGPTGSDPVAATDPQLGYQTAVYPLGTGFRHLDHPAVTVEGREPASDFPPLTMQDGGEPRPRSDEDFVCYRSFLLRRYTSASEWHLSVERPAGDGADLPGSIYVQDAGCSDRSDLRGLFPLYAGQRQLLASSESSEPCPNGDVIVLAVKAGAARGGESRAHLVYTMMIPSYDPNP